VPRQPRLAGLGRSLQGLAFGPDGRRIITAGLDGRADVYACDACGPEAGLLAVAARKIVRGLTPAERRTYLHERAAG
jgi:hypothetical protein